jgi:hypothetical protein
MLLPFDSWKKDKRKIINHSNNADRHNGKSSFVCNRSSFITVYSIISTQILLNSGFSNKGIGITIILRICLHISPTLISFGCNDAKYSLVFDIKYFCSSSGYYIIIDLSHVLIINNIITGLKSVNSFIYVQSVFLSSLQSLSITSCKLFITISNY